MKTKSAVTKRFALLYAVLLTLSLGLVGLSFGRPAAQAIESGSSGAYYLTEDRTTRGLWYNGENGSLDNPDADRNYGRDGTVLFYHWLRENGQPVKDISILNDFSEDTNYYYNLEKANYVEYPDYVTNITGDIQSVNDTPHGYWMNSTITFESNSTSSVNGAQLLPIDGILDEDGNQRPFVHGGFCSRTEINFDITADDSDWHIVSLLLGCPYTHKYNGYMQTRAQILAPDGTVLAERLVDDPNQNVYVRFAVKGSYTIHLEAVNGNGPWANGIFFDPYEYNADIVPTDFTATVQGARDVLLSWTGAENTYTAIHRRTVGETQWDVIAELAPGVNTYLDTGTTVATTYEYALAAATETKPYNPYAANFTKIDLSTYEPLEVAVKHYNLPDFEHGAEAETAAYKKTQITFEATSYSSVKNTEFSVAAQLKREGETEGEFVPYENIDVTFSLSGDNVRSDIGATGYANMDNIFGTAMTESDGWARFTGSVPYAGDYTLTASIELQPDDADPNQGYDMSSASVDLAITESVSTNPMTPIITSMTDAVEAGDTVTVTGFNIGNVKRDSDEESDEPELLIAYRPNEGTIPGAFDPTKEWSYIEEADLLAVDRDNGTGLMFTMPDVAPDTYDFYIRNPRGWSDGFTLNAARPLYIDQKAAYAGQEIQIVGRNFLESEYGLGDRESSYEHLRVKLTLVKAEGGTTATYSTTLSEANGGILTGIKCAEEDAMQFDEVDGNGDPILEAEDIEYTHEFRITIRIPDDMWYYGDYSISVAADGADYRPLSEPQTLKIVQKKRQEWNTTVFGPYAGSTAVGNDPLGLGVYWAQDLNYMNVVTMEENTFDDARTYSQQLNNTITTLYNQGGGVVYFPEGEYYLWNDIYMKTGVFFVGDGVDKTKIYLANDQNDNIVWFRAEQKAQDNIGFARLTLSTTHERLNIGTEEEPVWRVPNFITNWGGWGDYDQDIDTAQTENKFIIDVYGDFAHGTPATSNTSRQVILMGGEGNIVWKNFVSTNGGSYIRAKHYVQVWNVKMLSRPVTPIIQTKYGFIENSYFDVDAYDIGTESHGLSIRSDTYVAYSYCTSAGDRISPRNDGEALLAEVPNGYHSTGKVLGADARTVTLDYTGGKFIEDDTMIHYNKFAVYIADGTGQGQYRYIERAGEGEYANTYRLCDWEEDWDIIPDSTSVFSVINPLANITVYKYKAYDCASTVCLYYNMMDTVVYGCTLKDTGGVSVWGNAVGGMTGGRTTPSVGVRIENNDISGVGANYNHGYTGAQGGQGGILVRALREGDYMGVNLMAVTIRDNRLTDIIPEVLNTDAEGEGSLPGGISLYSGRTEGQDNPARNRFVVVEGNTIDGAAGGIYVDRLFVGVVVSDNTLTDCGYTDGVSIYQPQQFTSLSYHTLYVNGEVSDLSGVYAYSSVLPEPVSSDGSAFLGWTPDETYTEDSELIHNALGVNTTLYAVFGLQVTFDYNYLRSDGTERGAFMTVRVDSGETVRADVESYGGDPIRIGYTFGGWFTDKECTAPFDLDTPVTESFTVYAKWTAEDGQTEDPGTETPGEDNGNTGTPPERKEGCGCGSDLGGAAMGSAALAVTLTAAAAVLLRRRTRRQ